MKKKVKVFDTKYRIKQVDMFEADAQAGEINFEEHVITLASSFKDGTKLSKEQRVVAVVHELIHAALKEAKHPQYRNEKLVTPLAIGVGEALVQLGVSL
jgi:hypothetical protein